MANHHLPLVSSPDAIDFVPPPPPPKSALDRAFSSSSPPTSSPLRRTSVTSSDNDDNTSNKGSSLLSSSPPHPTPLVNHAVAAVTATASTKGAKRSSKLFGKLVPKFLQTSFGPNNQPGGASAPRSAVPVSPSPLSAMARPARSASFTSGSTVTPAASGTVVVNKSALPELPELPALSSLVLPTNEDWLGIKTDNNNGRRMSASPVLSSSPTAVESAKQQQPSAQFNMSIVTVEEHAEEEEEVTMEFRTCNNYEQGYFKATEERPLPVMPREDEQYKKQDHPFNMYNNNHHHHFNNQYHDEEDKRKDDSGSPYIIDDNCDDDFFLNSVLRKKNRPQPPPMLSTGSTGSGRGNSWRGTTPSLSAASSSSQASSMAPSPTSPTPVSTPLFTTSYPQQSGLDEKRSRLRDAVGEWRRSANASLNSEYEATTSPVSVSNTYSGFAS
ncbi:hypothetical protein BGX33_010131 [Mortierella sp. NVP41]|nr:hypothetical protein BGX33_010131 [Mortierella sp. NVP41]